MEVPEDYTTRGGLLYEGNTMVGLPHSDRIAEKYGFVFTERLVRYLEGRQGGRKMRVMINSPRTPVICWGCWGNFQLRPEKYWFGSSATDPDVPGEFTCPACGCIGETEIGY